MTKALRDGACLWKLAMRRTYELRALTSALRTYASRSACDDCSTLAAICLPLPSARCASQPTSTAERAVCVLGSFVTMKGQLLCVQPPL